MNREYYRWYSPTLNREMELIVLGHAGARVMIFPTSGGRFYDWENRGMHLVVADALERGELQWFCVDSVDMESWYAWGSPANARAYRQAQYARYLYDEVLPFTLSKNQNPYLMAMGASFGGYHAMNFGMQHPHEVNRILSFSGLYDIRRFAGGYMDDNVYFNSPMQFVAGETDPARIAAMQRQDIIMATGKDDRLMQSGRDFSGLLWSKGIGNALREWDGWAHDWPYWSKMLSLYSNGHD